MKVPVLHDPENVSDLDEWGDIPDMIEGCSSTSGVLLHKGPDGASECGLWVCTPGYWKCNVTRDEFTHFLSGRCTYTHEDGDTIDIVPNTSAFFPKGWKGTCRVLETIRKVYMIR